MPHYEYVCANGHRTEVMHGIHDAGPAMCPVCGATMRKAFVAPTFVFKGSGWAKMDRRSSSGAKKSGHDGGSTADAPTSDGGETKTAADTSTGTSSATGSQAESNAPGKASGDSD